MKHMYPAPAKPDQPACAFHLDLNKPRHSSCQHCEHSPSSSEALALQTYNSVHL